MKLIHEGGYSRDERESFKEIIFSNDALVFHGAQIEQLGDLKALLCSQGFQ